MVYVVAASSASICRPESGRDAPGKARAGGEVLDQPQSAIRVLGAIIGICTYCDPLANITSATIDRTMRTNASLCSFMPSQI